MPSRRAFLSKGLMLVSIGVAAPAFLAKTGYVTAEQGAARSIPSRGTLVVVQLSGGNDGLNPVIPYRDPLYRELRPQLGLPEGEVLPLDGTLALHPALAPLKTRSTPASLPSCAASATPTPTARTSARWTSGRPPSRRPTRRVAGWAG